ncbi:type II toxin-antitoxin system prevent-host-death family antitoxin [Rhodococcus hoagii]|nr:type II toxin-antitoxin system prevent-host-death family antitoxin [Prescottella equi]
MITWNSVTAGEAQDRLVEMVDEVVGEPNAGYEITVEGAVAAVLVSADEYESLRTIVEVVSDPESMRRYVEGLKELEEGDVLGIDEVRAMMRDAGRLPPDTDAETP